MNDLPNLVWQGTPSVVGLDCNEQDQKSKKESVHDQLLETDCDNVQAGPVFL